MSRGIFLGLGPDPPLANIHANSRIEPANTSCPPSNKKNWLMFKYYTAEKREGNYTRPKKELRKSPQSQSPANETNDQKATEILADKTEPESQLLPTAGKQTRAL